MEKYMAQCRLILLTESISKLIPALRSRCLGIRFVPSISFVKVNVKMSFQNISRVKAPSEQEIETVLEKVSTQEMIELSTNQQSQIVKSTLEKLITKTSFIVVFEAPYIFQFKCQEEISEKRCYLPKCVTLRV